jgi:hypothetical protein
MEDTRAENQDSGDVRSESFARPHSPSRRIPQVSVTGETGCGPQEMRPSELLQVTALTFYLFKMKLS